jgi:hypothetical protein
MAALKCRRNECNLPWAFSALRKSSGARAPDEIADLAHYYIGQSTRSSSPERVAALERWLRSKAEPGVHGEPRHKLPISAAPRLQSRPEPIAVRLMAMLVAETADLT